MGEHSYLIRYGVMSHVGRFSALPARDTSLERGQLVVIQTDRGVELGEVLIALDGQSAPARDGLEDARSGSSDDESRPFVPATRRTCFAWPAPTTCRALGPRKNCGRVASPSVNEFSRRGTGRGSSSMSSLCSMAAPRSSTTSVPISSTSRPCARGFVSSAISTWCSSRSGPTWRASFRMAIADDDDQGGGCGSCGCSDGGGCGSAAAEAPASHDHQAETRP